MSVPTTIRHLALFCLLASRCLGLTISIDYSADAAAQNFFSQRPSAKAAVDAAAADLSALLSPTHLTAISPSGTPNVNAISGGAGSTTVTANWDYLTTNPATEASVTIASPSIAADTIVIQPGLNGGSLGEGGPTGATVSLSASGFGSQLSAATSAMQINSNTYMGRGAGPVIGTATGTITLGANSAPFTLTFGPSLGLIVFNNDTNSDGHADTLAQLDAFWHYDPTTAVESNKIDFYTVALHEMMHALGLGQSDTFTSLLSGTTWLGSHAKALNGGSGTNLMNADGEHLADGYISTSLSTGQSQLAIMTASLAQGTRLKLTAMDAALLQDIGYQVATVPEPSGFVLLFGLTLAVVSRRRR